MTTKSPLSLTPVMGISWPRSGHHLLVRLLHSYFGPNFGYCEYHKAPPSLAAIETCCKQVPCAHFGQIHFTKNHDFDLNVPQIDGQKYLVQYRDFVPSAVSNFELFVRTGGEDTAVSFRRFASNQFTRYLGFTEKWITSDFAKSQLLVHYNDLTDDPEAGFARVVQFFEPGVTPDADRIRVAVQSVDGQKVEKAKTKMIKGAGVHAARDVQNFRYYAPKLFQTLDELCLPRADVIATFQKFLGRNPGEPNMLRLQCQPSADALEEVIKASPEYKKAHG